MSEKNDDGGRERVDPDDAPELTDAFFDNATYESNGVEIPKRKPGRPRADAPKVHTRLRLDADVLDAFKAQGPGWQTRMNDVLRAAVIKR